MPEQTRTQSTKPPKVVKKAMLKKKSFKKPKASAPEDFDQNYDESPASPDVA